MLYVSTNHIILAKFDKHFRKFLAIPFFTDDDVSLTVLVNTETLVPCNAQSDESITLSWTFKGVALDFPHSDYQLLTNGSLLIQSVAQSQEGEYVCTASNSAGTAQGTVQLTVQGKERLIIMIIIILPIS